MSATHAFWVDLTFRSVSLVPGADQEHPGYTAAEDVGADHLAEGPPLHVRGQNVASEHDPVAGAGEPVTQLDVFDCGPGIERGSKPPNSRKLSAHRAAAGPEGMSRPDLVNEHTLLMNEMMEEIPVLADDSRCGGLVVV